MTLAAAPQTIASYYDSGTGKVQTGTRMKMGINGYFATNFTYSNSFLNLMKSGSVRITNNTTGVSPDANGYYDSSVGSWQYQASNYVPAGTYVLVWTGTSDAEWQVGIYGSEIDIGAAGYPTVNRREYSIPSTFNTPLYTRFFGGTTTDAALFNKDHETEYDAGNVLNPDYVTQFGNTDTFRFMDWQTTNGSIIRDFTDYVPFAYISWVFDSRFSAGNPIATSIPPQALALSANELTADLWVNISHQSTDACVTSFCNEVDTYKDAARNVHMEYCNENWNTASGFRDSNRWMEYGDAAVRETDGANSVDPLTGICTQVAHGMLTDDPIVCFNNIYQTVSPWANGSDSRAIVKIDDDHFYAAGNIDSITKGTTCTVTTTGNNYMTTGDTVTFRILTGMTELDGNSYTITRVGQGFTLDGVDSTAFTTFTSGLFYGPFNNTVNGLGTITFLRYKKQTDSSLTRVPNFSARSIAVWDLAEAVFGAKLIKQGGGWWNSSGTTTSMLAETGYREAIDFMAFAPYWNPWTLNSPLTNYDSMTTAEIREYYEDVWNPANMDVVVPQQIAALGHTRISCYEGGQDGNNAGTAADWAKKVEFGDSVDVTLSYDFYCRYLADNGFDIFNQYAAVDDQDGKGVWWGLIQNIDDIGTNKYLGWSQFVPAGAPKN